MKIFIKHHHVTFCLKNSVYFIEFFNLHFEGYKSLYTYNCFVSTLHECLSKFHSRRMGKPVPSSTHHVKISNSR